MHGDYYRNKRFSNEYLDELAVLMVCFFFIIVIALGIGFWKDQVKIVNDTSPHHQIDSVDRQGSGGLPSRAAAAEPQSTESIDPGKSRAIIAGFSCVALSLTIVLISIFRQTEVEDG
jgi:hypothetical protein